LRKFCRLTKSKQYGHNRGISATKAQISHDCRKFNEFRTQISVESMTSGTLPRIRSSDFVNASLFQIQGACRSPWGGISELSMNAALAMIEAAAPKDEIEGALAVQMACTHTAAMAVLAKLDVAFATEQRVAALGSAAARLMRAYATQVEVLRRLRNGGLQFVRVEHVHVNDGGQALIGNVKKEDAGT
jgi:hypothetical protein